MKTRRKKKTETLCPRKPLSPPQIRATKIPPKANIKCPKYRLIVTVLIFIFHFFFLLIKKKKKKGDQEAEKPEAEEEEKEEEERKKKDDKETEKDEDEEDEEEEEEEEDDDEYREESEEDSDEEEGNEDILESSEEEMIGTRNEEKKEEDGEIQEINHQEEVREINGEDEQKEDRVQESNDKEIYEISSDEEEEGENEKTEEERAKLRNSLLDYFRNQGGDDTMLSFLDEEKRNRIKCLKSDFDKKFANKMGQSTPIKHQRRDDDDEEKERTPTLIQETETRMRTRSNSDVTKEKKNEVVPFATTTTTVSTRSSHYSPSYMVLLAGKERETCTERTRRENEKKSSTEETHKHTSLTLGINSRKSQKKFIQRFKWRLNASPWYPAQYQEKELDASIYHKFTDEQVLVMSLFHVCMYSIHSKKLETREHIVNYFEDYPRLKDRNYVLKTLRLMPPHSHPAWRCFVHGCAQSRYNSVKWSADDKKDYLQGKKVLSYEKTNETIRIQIEKMVDSLPLYRNQKNATTTTTTTTTTK